MRKGSPAASTATVVAETQRGRAAKKREAYALAKRLGPMPSRASCRKMECSRISSRMRFVGEALLVVAEDGRGVDARQDGRLPRRALRPTLDAEPRVGAREQPVEWKPRLLAFEDGERRGLVAQKVERVVRPSRANAEPVHEDEKYRHRMDK